ncbi:hypothetical protein P5673_001144 [Acropora cervicornis]|uniref:Uncharacterized protein n=1 Tax=Acropora cervicornis TaxID=6130 RepID=A0AAD9R5F0_ACRCE|nr:hypothetical protein P5673_001144 [Acropora cervicornis]
MEECWTEEKNEGNIALQEYINSSKEQIRGCLVYDKCNFVLSSSRYIEVKNERESLNGEQAMKMDSYRLQDKTKSTDTSSLSVDR